MTVSSVQAELKVEESGDGDIRVWVTPSKFGVPA